MIQQIKNSSNILIISHPNPDGDTLGSMCALNLALKSMGKKTTMLTQGKVPDVYAFLPSIKDTKSYFKGDFVQKTFDLAITVDIAAYDRITEAAKVAFEAARSTINIDHHKTNCGFAKFNLICPEAASVGEILFDFFMDNKIEITQDIAKCLYVSILTDTGGFKYENTSAKTLKIAAQLVELGINPCDVYRQCYESKPKPMVLLQAFCVQNAKFLMENKIAYTLIKNEYFNKFNALNEHTEGICEALRQIDSVEVSAVLKEADQNATKVSLRSKTVDVSEIAAKFGGGGHKFASGCTINKPLKIAQDKLLEEICRKKL